MSTRATLQKILARAYAAFDNNRYSKHNKGTLSADNTPTVTGYTTAAWSTAGGPAAFPHAYAATVTPPLPYVFGGGTPAIDGYGLRYKSTAAGTEGHSAHHDYILHGQDLVVELDDYMSTYRFLVKEGGSFKYVNADGIGGTPAGSSGTKGTGKVVYKLHFPTRNYREIRVECYAAGAQSGGSYNYEMGRIGAVYVAAGDQVFAPRDPGVSAVIFGDSNNQGVNGPAPDARGHVAYAHLGIDNVRNASVWGNGASTWDDRRSDWADLDPSPTIIEFQPSWTDLGSVSTTVPLMMTEIELARTTHPDAIIIVQGLPQARTETDVSAMNAAVKSAVEALDDNLTRYEELQSAYEGPLYGAESGLTGNYAEMCEGSSPGNGHFTRAGDMHIGIHTAQQRIALLEDILANIPESTGSGGITLLPDTATLLFEQDVERTQGLSVASDGTLVAVANVVPTLPDGLDAIIEDGALKLSGTPTTLTAEDEYAITVELSGGGFRLFTLLLAVVEELIEFELDMLYSEPYMLHYSGRNNANTVPSTGLVSVLDDMSGNGFEASAQGPLATSQMYTTGVETLNGHPLLTAVDGTHDGRFDIDALGLLNNVDGVSIYMLIRLDAPMPNGVYGQLVVFSDGTTGNARAALFGGGTSISDILLGGRRIDGETLKTIRDGTDREGVFQIISARINFDTREATLRINGEETKALLYWDNGSGQTSGTNSISALLTNNLPDRTLAEVIVRRGLDDDALAYKVEGKIAIIYDSQDLLKSDHPYKNTVPLA